ncbi:hypothetical protein A2210_02130 [Candidatus Woesebacteria bacterium RIFOXYA1_FULL_40_18]|uniref:DUF5660 domain-containing protein n=1 Tax=Candidatus Woesebacteria bacterium RIFOXYA1_FULL_40_18 TaxID=1802532 RepID=A0A1F8CIG3_9BACT|nr:MAG: hypothetical protein A2210_02130 [Candidatus Woesebacteria bacterium RIFOXYA1_FULL_40_18]
MDKAQKLKNSKTLRQANVLESLKDISGGTVKSLKSDLFEKTGGEFFSQLFGPREKKYSGDIIPGETLEFSDVFSGKQEENKKLKGQIALERQLVQEEKSRIDKKSNELKLQLHAIMQEVLALAQTTQNIGQEVEIASIQAPVNPGVYHVIFFEKLLEFIKSFRRKIEDAGVWLHASNEKALKKNYWGLYKKHGSKFLLSPDHYLQRSAG